MTNNRIWWKIVVGAVLILVSVGNFPMYTNGSTQANTGLALTFLALAGGFYLIYRGLYPNK